MARLPFRAAQKAAAGVRKTKKAAIGVSSGRPKLASDTGRRHGHGLKGAGLRARPLHARTHFRTGSDPCIRRPARSSIRLQKRLSRADRSWVRRMIDRIESERGSILIEVLVSAVMLVITAVGVFSAFEAGNRASARSDTGRRRRGWRRPTWPGCGRCGSPTWSTCTKRKIVDGREDAVHGDSVATFETDENGTASCQGRSLGDYIEIRSTVSWPTLGTRKAVVAVRVSSSAERIGLGEQRLARDPDRKRRKRRRGGSRPQRRRAESFAGVTGEHGCAIFGDLTAGNYTVTLTVPPRSTN